MSGEGMSGSGGWLLSDRVAIKPSMMPAGHGEVSQQVLTAQHNPRCGADHIVQIHVTEHRKGDGFSVKKDVSVLS